MADAAARPSPSDRVNIEEIPVEPELWETPGHLIRRCQQRSQAIFKEVLGPFGLTQRQTALLLGLAKRPDISSQQLADLTGTDRNTLSDVAKRLQKRGLLERRRSRHDVRAYDLRLSASGARLLDHMAPGIAEVQERLLEPLQEDEREAFVRMARTVARLA